MSSPNTVILKPTRLSDRYDEARAAGTIKPGHLIKHDANGAVVVHSAAGVAAELMVAIEDSFQGKTIDDNYVATDLVRFHRCQDGDEMYMLLANNQSVNPTSFLTSNGDGTLKAASGTDVILFKSVETLLNASGAAARLRVRAAKTAGVGTTTTTSTTTTTTTTP